MFSANQKTTSEQKCIGVCWFLTKFLAVIPCHSVNISVCISKNIPKKFVFCLSAIWDFLPYTGTAYYTRHQAPRAQRHIWTAVKGAIFCLSAIWGSLPCTGTYYTSHQAPRAQRHIWTVPAVTATVSGRHFGRLTPGVFIYDWTRFSGKKSCLFWVDRNPTLASASYLATLLWRKNDEEWFSPKLRVRIKDNNNSPHGEFHRFLLPFSSKFSDLNFTSYVLYIYVTCHTQWAWVTYGSDGSGHLN